jgi:hypothetical protein
MKNHEIVKSVQANQEKSSISFIPDSVPFFSQVPLVGWQHEQFRRSYCAVSPVYIITLSIFLGFARFLAINRQCNREERITIDVQRAEWCRVDELNLERPGLILQLVWCDL